MVLGLRIMGRKVKRNLSYKGAVVLGVVGRKVKRKLVLQRAGGWSTSEWSFCSGSLVIFISITGMLSKQNYITELNKTKSAAKPTFTIYNTLLEFNAVSNSSNGWWSWERTPIQTSGPNTHLVSPQDNFKTDFAYAKLICHRVMKKLGKWSMQSCTAYFY